MFTSPMVAETKMVACTGQCCECDYGACP